jgi:hypothetical protein
MTRSVPRTVRKQWIQFLTDVGIEEATATNMASMIAGNPRLSFQEIEGPEDARSAVETAAFLIEQFDLEELDVEPERQQPVQEAMLVAHRYGLVEHAPLESVYADPSAHALADLPTINHLLASEDTMVQRWAISILKGLSDTTLGEILTDAAQARLRELASPPAAPIGDAAECILDRLGPIAPPDPSEIGPAGGYSAPSSELLANLQEGDAVDGSQDDEANGDDDENSSADSDS